MSCFTFPVSAFATSARDCVFLNSDLRLAVYFLRATPIASCRLVLPPPPRFITQGITYFEGTVNNPPCSDNDHLSQDLIVVHGSILLPLFRWTYSLRNLLSGLRTLGRNFLLPRTKKKESFALLTLDMRSLAESLQ
ncbi:Uncharacterized protein Fot_24299 [Forsythia ovata]|uniref:Uncharacterized protein n=1 Tax=Forsythia ovata TaxID=205694 RepID=A0ABD1U5T9_9LAMI